MSRGPSSDARADLPHAGVQNSGAVAARHEQDGLVAGTAWIACLVAAGVVLALVVRDVLMLDGWARTTLVVGEVVTGTALAALGWWLRGQDAEGRVRWSRTAVVVVVGVLHVHTLVWMVVTHDLLQTTNTGLAVIFLALLQLEHRRYAFALGALLATWALAVGVALLTGTGAAQVDRAALILLSAALLSLLAHLAVRRSLNDLHQAHRRAEAHAIRDELTGLLNRRGVEVMGGQVLEAARRRGDAMHVVFLDVDGMQRVNESLGRAAGDDVLLAVAEALRASTRASDVVGRWGGDEFVVLGPGTGTPALEMERRVRAMLVERPPVPRGGWTCRVSAGGAVLEPWDAGDLDALLGRADADMHLRRALRAPSAVQPHGRRGGDRDPR